MTGAEFSGVDTDLLADYVGGALDGTPDETVVTALIAEDPAWREAYARLSGGVAAVTGQLRALGSVAEPMPADVFARLDAALLTAATDQQGGGELVSIGDVRAGAGRGRASGEATAIDAASTGATAAPAAMEPGTDGAAVDRHLVAVSSGSRGKRARRLRWAAPIGIAAGVLAFGFVMQQQLPGESADSATSSDSGGEQPASAPRAAAGGQELSLPTGSVPVTETGTDYRQTTLGQANRALAAPELPQEAGGDQFRSGPGAGKGSASTGDPFSRLRVQEALQACIQAIASQHGVGEITPQTVDFARFDGAPAVIVEFTAADRSWVWASGPACGAPGVGADTLASVQVG